MNSVRLRLLVLALIPLIVLMPLLMLIGMARWTADYDEVLIANVESDLRIAEQYLARIMAGTGDDLRGAAGAADFARVLTAGPEAQRQYFARKRTELELDFLTYLPMAEARQMARKWPVIASALQGTADTQIDIFEAEDLAALPGALAVRARIPLIETEAAVPTDRRVEDRGMVVHSASPVRLAGQDGVLVGGILLNRNLQFIDTINALVYLNAVTGGDRQGTATLFLDDVRVSTNVRLFEDVRALGTRVSAAVRGAVLDDGQTWLDRAFVVNDWYISGYHPITDSFGNRVGMLYVGFLEEPFAAAKRDAYLWMITAFAGVLLLSAPVFLWLAKGIFAPLERMTQTMNRVRQGNLSARIGNVGSRDEIGQVASHLDSLLGMVQERDQRLRAWADQLNQRVDQRTAELREANAKLEETFRQLVMSEKLASIGEITAGVAHEINNPVAVIQGNVDVMRECLPPESAAAVKTELDLIDQQVTRIDAIVGKLLQFARPGDYASYDRTVDLGPVVGDCLVLVEHEISKRQIAVTQDLPPTPPVRIDPGEMQQVVINLIVNAVQAMGQTGALSLTLGACARDEADGVCLTVRDSGPGIAPDRLDSVFDPFFTTKQAEGTGLGLSISQTLIQRAGGIITARNHPSGGAEFTVWLPVAA
ncbi:cache domain-containing protein [Tropicibacter naphthalenivorans]|uniref:histidine kinase n=1 Tax=Tropicibacter naphthalenivorans TaxID=441103 RepID=A0A0P1GGP3_9RHOB|nr:cache domain-containing protein [Tropicibacter naphthalenivorans]CUH80789.1 Sensor protein ZraS [Tropicibacter naphthalenivorans]SMC90227.1 two-component system, NtrC family, sensor kinase [Tropicibacter naphthalenivorans]